MEGSEQGALRRKSLGWGATTSEKPTPLSSPVTATWGKTNTLLHGATPCETKDGVTALKLGSHIDTTGPRSAESISDARDKALNFKPRRSTQVIFED